MCGQLRRLGFVMFCQVCRYQPDHCQLLCRTGWLVLDSLTSLELFIYKFVLKILSQAMIANARSASRTLGQEGPFNSCLYH